MKKSKDDSNNDVDALFTLPLAEFTNRRNALAAELKKSGKAGEAAAVKALGKPSVSAWAVNQLYWNHRDAFDKLIASGERFHKAQSSRGGAKVADMRAALDARREALTQLSNIAASMLKHAGHNPSPDTIHRITTTLEGISAYASSDDGPQPGRLTQDVDPPGFESVGSFVPAKPAKQTAVREKQKAEGRKLKAGSTQRAEDDKRKFEDANEKKIAAAKASIQEAKKSLADAQTRVKSLQAAQTRAQADLKQAEERLKEATKRVRNVEQDLKEAGREAAEAERRVEEATKDLDAVSN